MPGRLSSGLFCAVLSTLCLSVATAGEVQPSGSSDILPKNAKLQELWNEGEFTEGVAVARDGKIYFSDIAMGDDGVGRILQYDPETGKTTVFVADSGKSNGLMFDRKGNLVACCGAHKGLRALCYIRKTGKDLIANEYQGKPLNSPNDLTIHPDGTIFFSDPRYVGTEAKELDHMSVYRYDPKTKSLTLAITSIDKPNGLGLSPDGKTLYVAETDNGSLNVQIEDPNVKRGRMTLNAFPVESDGTLGNKRVLVDFGKGPGVDGMTIDRQGNIYAAVRADERHGIRVYSPEGKELAYIPTKELPTNCCFGRGSESKILYVTAGGGLYRIPLKISGHHPATAEQQTQPE